MPDRKVEFTIAAKDDASAVLKHVGTSFEELRKKLSLPITGPLSREQATIERAALSRLTSKVEAQQRAQLDKLLGVGGDGGKGGLLSMFAKFGATGELGSIKERFAEALPKVAAGLAVAKAVGSAAGFANRIVDTRRHNAQMNLDRQVEDEKYWNDLAGTISLGIGPSINELLNVNNYKSDKIAIEELEDATRKQDAYTDRLKARFAIEKALIENAKQLNEATRLQFDARGFSPERGTFLSSVAALQQFNKKLDDAGFDTSGGVRRRGGAVLGELEEQQSNLQRAARLALLDLAGADVGRAKSLGAAVWGNVKALVREDFDKFKDVRRIIAQMESETENIRLRMNSIGLGDADRIRNDLEADLQQIRADAKAATAGLDLNDPRRDAADKLAAAKEAAAKANAADALRRVGIADMGRADDRKALLRSLQLGALKKIVGLGDQSLALQLERLQITDQTESAKRPLLDLLRNPTASLLDRLAAQAGIGFLDSQGNALMRSVGANNFQGATAPGNYGAALLTGKAQATREATGEDKSNAQSRADIRQGLKLLEEMNRGIEEIRAVFKVPIVGEVFKGLFGNGQGSN